jgi:uncharacterized protein (DUF2249 family)
MAATDPREVSQAIYDRHQALFYRLLEHLKILEEQADSDPRALAQFLTEQILPQVVGEEAYVYPSLHAKGTTTDSMSVDHEFIEAYVRRIEREAERLARAPKGEQATSRKVLVRLGRQLEAILELHLAKEDHIYLPLLQEIRKEQQQPLAEQATLKSEQPEPAMRKGTTEVKDLVDVRGLSPAARHARTFATFGAVQPGEAFILVSDHDPQPLYYQLTFEYHGQLIWDSLEKGPDTWRVRIGKGA